MISLAYDTDTIVYVGDWVYFISDFGRIPKYAGGLGSSNFQIAQHEVQSSIIYSANEAFKEDQDREVWELSLIHI